MPSWKAHDYNSILFNLKYLEGTSNVMLQGCSIASLQSILVIPNYCQTIAWPITVCNQSVQQCPLSTQGGTAPEVI